MTHLQTNKNPMTEARRNAIHGPLEPMKARERYGWWAVGCVAFWAVFFTCLAMDLGGLPA